VIQSAVAEGTSACGYPGGAKGRAPDKCTPLPESDPIFRCAERVPAGKGDLRGAIDFYERGLLKDPRDFRTLFNRGYALELLARPAIHWWHFDSRQLEEVSIPSTGACPPGHTLSHSDDSCSGMFLSIFHGKIGASFSW